MLSTAADERDLAVELLMSMKRFFKFKELENLLNISVPTIWRYIHGEIKPSIDRAREMLNKLLSRDVLNIVRDKILSIYSNGIVNVYNLAYSIDILSIASIDAYLWAYNLRPTAIVTAETDGIPLATLIAKRLNAKLATVKRRKDVGFKRFYETNYIAYDPPGIVTLYLPEGVLNAKDRVLIVDDLVRSGRTSQAVAELVKQSGAEVVGFYALIGMGSAWKSTIEKIVGSSYRVLFEVSQHTDQG